jgi:predicted Fe-Mo cluster-binding NifX family protein
MKIAISTEEGSVSAHFGRCPSYTLADIQDGKVVERGEIPNPGHTPGFLPRFLSGKGVEVIIAGGMGSRAQGLFAENHIRTIIGVQGRVEEVIGRFARGELESGPDLCDHEHGREGPFRDAPRPSSGPGEDRPITGTICVSALGDTLEAEVDPRFGRAAYYLFLDPGTGKVEAFRNPFSDAGHGAGIQAAQFVVDKRPAAILTGRVGPNAARVLEAAGIKIVSAEGGRVREALARLKEG